MAIASYAHAVGPKDELVTIDDDDILEEEDDDAPLSVFDHEKAHDDA